MTSWVRRLAAAAPVPVFVAAGSGGRRAVREVLGDGRFELVSSPRHATVLLVAGAVPHHDQAALAHVHDQLPHPRAVVWLAPGSVPPAFVDPTVGDPSRLDLVVEAHRQVVSGQRPSSPRLLPAEHPVAWQGTGDHGQGGEGMMGGTPYGRPMAMTGPDLRDGLQLDRVPVSVGPYLAPWWPPGLELDLELQGDVIVRAEVADARPFDGVLDGAVTAGGGAGPDVVLEVLLALGDRGRARRWIAGRADRDAVGHALLGIPAGTGHSDHDDQDVRQRVLAAVDGEAPAGGLEHLPHLLPGLAWREAAVTIASLGLDLRHPGPGAVGTTPPGASTVALEARR